MVGSHPRAAVVGLVALAGGCDVDFVSESGRLGFDAPELRRATLEDFASGDAIAVGSRVCPQFDGYQDGDSYREISNEDDDALRSCFDIEALGPATYDGRCLEVDGPGEVTWSLQPRGESCIDDVSFESDQVRFDAVALADVVTEEAALVERLATSGTWTIPEGTLPPDLVPAVGAPLVVVEGVTVTAQVGLREPAGDRIVAWTDGQVVVTPASAEVQTYGEDGEDELDGHALLRLVDGTTAEVALHVAGAPAPALQVESVPETELTDLQIVGFFSVDGEAGLPTILRAIARDASGRLVRGVPVTWSSDDDIQWLSLWGEGRDPDYVMVDVACREDDEPATTEHGTVTATLGEQSATLDVVWVRPLCSEIEEGGDDGRPAGSDDGDDPGGRDDEDGLASCACTSGNAGPSPLHALLLGGVALGLRRRRAR
jgi:MYXO-CTERM domain-containing protein